MWVNITHNKHFKLKNTTLQVQDKLTNFFAASRKFAMPTATALLQWKNNQFYFKVSDTPIDKISFIIASQMILAYEEHPPSSLQYIIICSGKNNSHIKIKPKGSISYLDIQPAHKQSPIT